MSEGGAPREGRTPPRDGEKSGAPLGFKLFLGLAVLYLGWRLAQGVMWVIGWLG